MTIVTQMGYWLYIMIERKENGGILCFVFHLELKF